MSAKKRAREVSVGVTLTLALVILAALILLLGQESKMFRPRIGFVTTVPSSVGLKSGSPVLMGGVQIGTVQQVRLVPDPKAKGIALRLSVDRAFAERIRHDSIASVGYITLLSGEKFVNISPGDPAQPALQDGAEIPRDNSETLLETGQNLAENLASVTGHLKEMLERIERGEGLVGQIVKSKDPYFGEDTFRKMGDVFDRTDTIVRRIEQGDGLVGRLINDRDYAHETLDSVRSAAGRLDRVLEQIEKNHGAVGDLLREDGKAKALIADMRDASASLRAVAARLGSTTGLFGRLLNDTEYSEAAARDFRSITTSLSSILGKIDRGEGTAGALVNDPSVYMGLQDIVAGIKDSRFAKKTLQHYGDKGAKMSTGSGAQGAPPPK